MGKTSNSNGNGARADAAIFPITIAITITGLAGYSDWKPLLKGMRLSARENG